MFGMCWVYLLDNVHLGRVVDWTVDGLKTASGASGLEIDEDAMLCDSDAEELNQTMEVLCTSNNYFNLEIWGCRWHDASECSTCYMRNKVALGFTMIICSRFKEVYYTDSSFSMLGRRCRTDGEYSVRR